MRRYLAIGILALAALALPASTSAQVYCNSSGTSTTCTDPYGNTSYGNTSGNTTTWTDPYGNIEYCTRTGSVTTCSR
jgi:hypothetical protein